MKKVKKQKYKLIAVDERAPKKNELYINKSGQVQRCKDNAVSKRAQKRVIVKEKWLVGKKGAPIEALLKTLPIVKIAMDRKRA